MRSVFRSFSVPPCAIRKSARLLVRSFEACELITCESAPARSASTERGHYDCAAGSREPLSAGASWRQSSTTPGPLQTRTLSAVRQAAAMASSSSMPQAPRQSSVNPWIMPSQRIRSDVHAGCLESLCIGKTVVAQHIVFRNGDNGRGQAGKTGGSLWRKLRHVRCRTGPIHIPVPRLLGSAEVEARRKFPIGRA